MNETIHQQIVISGVGGQGVLFVTRLMAEAAIRKGLPVLTSETHGMAQRGGTVISHLKVGAYTSPLIRTGQADVLLAMKDEGAAQHGHYLHRNGWAVVNGAVLAEGWRQLDADGLAHQIGNPRAVNLVVLGGVLAEGAPHPLFCTAEDIRAVMAERLAAKPALLEKSYKALDAGLQAVAS
ncbi:MAG: indolepyruvate oxidoreductase [Desulfobacteraceae bacterium]|nr:indolepyruvate oxidoreductase [Desulfobacteraceae bacterium]MBC2749957.1 2-oxoacid:acceptor oxidoreductase family protein [Desulfobacteraceae bacterium]